MRTRRARYVATGNVLSAQRLRSFAGTQPDRSWARIFRGPEETEIRRPQCSRRREREWFAESARRVSDEKQRSAAAAPLFGLARGRTDRRSHERQFIAELERRDRHGL